MNEDVETRLARMREDWKALEIIEKRLQQCRGDLICMAEEPKDIRDAVDLLIVSVTVEMDTLLENATALKERAEVSA